MTNEERFTTPERRVANFEIFCAHRLCDECAINDGKGGIDGARCLSKWLALPIVEEDEETLEDIVCEMDIISDMETPSSLVLADYAERIRAVIKRERTSATLAGPARGESGDNEQGENK